MSSHKRSIIEETTSHDCLSSSPHLEIVLDDHSDCDSIFGDFDNQTYQPKSSTTNDENNIPRRRRQLMHKSPKPHRLIEKRRRDRMNSSLLTLLELVPHKKSENQKRIEKTEIIEMAIKYIRNSIASNHKPFEVVSTEKQSLEKLRAYRFGYHNCICDTYEHLEKHCPRDRIIPDFIRFSTDKEIELHDITTLPERKTLQKSKPRSSHPDEHICTVSNARTIHDHENVFQFSIDDEENTMEQTKVPIFVLHPSGTHYIPMCIDSSIVAHAFQKKSNLSHSSSMNEQFHCHPVSIPVNFNPVSAVSDPYGLDIQNINVIATRHQTSVRPN